jgi:hypothetical protein
MKHLLTLLLACLTLATAASTLPSRAEWMAQVQTSKVRSLGQFYDGNVLLGQDALGRPRLALERPVKGAANYVAWGTRLGGPASAVSLIVPKLYAPLDLLLQLGGPSPAVVGLDAHTGQERWREPGRFVEHDDVRIIIESGRQRVRRNVFTRARVGGG